MNTVLFISHATEDNQWAGALVELVRSALSLPPECIVCTSLPGYGFDPGSPIAGSIRNGALNCKVMIVLVSARSHESSFVRLEVGARWGSDKLLISVLAPSAKLEFVPELLRTDLVVSMSSRTDLQVLVEVLAKNLDAKVNAPNTYMAQVARIEQLIPQSRSVARPVDPESLFSEFLRTSKLGQRLGVSDHAKWAIAKYCKSSGFWKKEDALFIESGTLPVYMILELCRERNDKDRPRTIVTNNLACSVLAVAARPAELHDDDWKAEYVNEDVASNLVVLGGRVIEDYAGTVPEDWPDSELGAEDIVPDRITSTLEKQGVNHVVMMITKLGDRGPCAASAIMRRYKKLLLKYVCDHPNARLSILGEGEKLIERHGSPAEEVDGGTTRYWEQLLVDGRVTLISALSPELSKKIGWLKNQMRSVRDAGAKAILVDIDGRPVAID